MGTPVIAGIAPVARGSHGCLASALPSDGIDEYGVVDDLDESDHFDTQVRTAVERSTSRPAAPPSGNDYFKSRQAALAELMGSNAPSLAKTPALPHAPVATTIVSLSALEFQTKWLPSTMTTAELQLQIVVQ